MKHSPKYDGKNPIPDANRAHKNNVAPALDDMPTPAETTRAAAQAAVAITRVDAKCAADGAPDTDPNVNVKHATMDKADAVAKPDPLAKVPSGVQILADTSKLAAGKRAAS